MLFFLTPIQSLVIIYSKIDKNVLNRLLNVIYQYICIISTQGNKQNKIVCTL